MKKGKSHILISILFIGIFMMKMAISLSPLFLAFNNNKVVSAVILQLEMDGKNEKDNTEKDLFKDKKFFDEDKDLVIHCYRLAPILLQNNLLHNQEHALFLETYHPVVLTPPPNA